MLHQAGLVYPLLDLRTGAVDQYQPCAQTVEQGDVVNQAGEVIMIFERLAAKTDDESFAAMGIDIGAAWLPTKVIVSTPVRPPSLTTKMTSTRLLSNVVICASTVALLRPL
jgi:hypothetical protein